MSNYLGDFKTSQTVRIPWSTNDQTGASITYTSGTFRVRKNGDRVNQVSTGLDVTRKDIGTNAGDHEAVIDLASDLTFYAAGNEFYLVVEGIVVDTKSMTKVIGHFSIRNRKGIVEDVMNYVTEGAFTLVQVIRLWSAVWLGKSNTLGTIFRDLGDTKPRVTSTIDGSKNRTNMTLDGT